MQVQRIQKELIGTRWFKNDTGQECMVSCLELENILWYFIVNLESGQIEYRSGFPRALNMELEKNYHKAH